jgi:hypothetical protein
LIKHIADALSTGNVAAAIICAVGFVAFTILVAAGLSSRRHR